MVALFVLLLGAWLFGLGTPSAFNFPRPFDAQLWKAAGTSGVARCGMVSDLRYRIGLIGKTRNQVTNLLGPPEDEDKDKRSSHYHLCPSFMDIYILEIEWKNEIVYSVVVRDT
jgi:hypothetical protein